ncbi:hypothetical protein MED121_14794 [Marinomonas sp. MED121]|uniref:TRAP transporter substrate-binding protein n=1 Tax=Marinomonas sp. MED121 TaxID=314277 RepID=UPI00006911D0|nr:TRAP transporter substrate-binding protein DctP [Marinomonas sp. MED121]EAQ67204.1 hypothetical protein MED121_14794 [Marinomonas sp. MED121]
MDKTRRLWISRLIKGSGCAALYTSHPLLADSPLSNEKENAMRANADYIMVYASPYSTQDHQFCPHMHHELKKNIEEMSSGRIYLDIQDTGVLGTGHELMAKVSRGAISAALVSVSNLAPAAPELDILNIPFWSSKEQDYLNLVTSDTWKNLIIKRIKSQGKLDILFHYLPGSRTVSTTMKNPNVIKRPDELQGVIFRVPNSHSLKTFYQLAEASPVDVDWLNVSRMAKSGRIHAMDPSIIGLHNGPLGLREHIGSISQIQSVYDGWMAVVSQQWYSTLPTDLKLVLKDASEKTFRQHLDSVSKIRKACTQSFEDQGTLIYTLTDDERNEWVSRFGPTNETWTAVKRNILGDDKTFEKLLEATKINNGYRISTG